MSEMIKVVGWDSLEQVELVSASPASLTLYSFVVLRSRCTSSSSALGGRHCSLSPKFTERRRVVKACEELGRERGESLATTTRQKNSRKISFLSTNFPNINLAQRRLFHEHSTRPFIIQAGSAILPVFRIRRGYALLLRCAQHHEVGRGARTLAASVARCLHRL